MTGVGSDGRIHADVDEAGPLPTHQVVDVGGVPSSGILLLADDPRGVIVALHGGGTTSVYYDCPGYPRHSLLRAAASAGFSVLALDRPGYGSSHDYADQFAAPESRVDFAFDAIDAHLGAASRGAGIFLVCHSAGCELGLLVASDPRGRDLLGIELCGTGIEHHPEAVDLFFTMPGVKPNRAAFWALLWNPPGLYPPELVGGATIGAQSPRYEARVAEHWTQENFANYAARVAIPVHFTAGEFERVWRTDPPALREITALFTAAPRMVAQEQPDGGHNLSLGYAAMAYHLRIVSFVEECIGERGSRSSELR